jgi:transposase
VSRLGAASGAALQPRRAVCRAGGPQPDPWRAAAAREGETAAALEPASGATAARRRLVERGAGSALARATDRAEDVSSAWLCLLAATGADPAAATATAWAGRESRAARSGQKKLRRKGAALRALQPRAKLEVWAQDQARRGLKPLVRRLWARRGQRPLAVSPQGSEWSDVYGFVQPRHGRTHWALLPEVNTAALQLVLDDFGRAHQLGPRTQVVLLVERAPWPRTPKLHVPAGIQLSELPPYTPELQPAERLWPLLNEGVANRPYHTIRSLERTLVRRCQLPASPTGPDSGAHLLLMVARWLNATIFQEMVLSRRSR